MPEITTTAPAAVTPSTPASVIPGQPSKNSPAPAPVKTTEVPGDDADLGKWAGLRRQLRETQAKLNEVTSKAGEYEKKVADLEQLRPVADKHGAVEKLVKEGKWVDAMKAAGVEVEQAFTQWVEENENNPTPSGPPKELTDLMAKYEALEARLKGDDDAKAKAATEAKTKADEAARASVVTGLTDKITAEGSRWVRCAKEPAEASQTAFGVAKEKAQTLIAERAKALGVNDVSKLTAEQRAAVQISDADALELFDLALDAVEAEYKALAEKFHVAEPARVRPATVPHIGDYIRKPGADPSRDSSPVAERKVSVTLDGTRGSLRGPKETETRGKLSAGDAKAKALRSIRALSRT